MKKLVCILLSIVWLLAACSGDGRMQRRLQTLDTLVDHQPDSVLELISCIDADSLTQADRMHLELLRAKAMNKAYVDFTTDSVMLQVADYYDRHGTPNQQMLAHYLLGCTYRDMGSAPKAIESYLEATSKADTTAADCDFRTLSSVYSQMAHLYGLQILSSKETECRRKAYRCAKRAGNAAIAAYEYSLLSRPYMFQGRRDSAIITLQNAKQMYETCGGKQAWLEMSASLLYLYIQEQNIDSAQALIHSYDGEFTLFDENGDLPASHKSYFSSKGDFFLLSDKPDSAEYYYRKSFHDKMNFSEQTQTYHGLLRLYQRLHIADSIAKYAKLYCMCNDSTYNYRDRDITSKVAASYNYSIHEKQALHQRMRSMQMKNRLQLSISVLVLVIVVFILIWRRYRQKIHEMERISKESEDLINDYQRKVSQLQKMENVHRDVISMIQSELDHSNSKADKLSHELQSLTKEYRTEVDSLRHQLMEKSLVADANGNVKNPSDFFKTKTAMIVREKVLHPSSPISEDEWSQLHKAVKEFFPEFIAAMESNTCLTKKMQHVCILSIMELRTKDIASAMGTSVQSISNMRQEASSILFGDNSARNLSSNLRRKYHIEA